MNFDNTLRFIELLERASLRHAPDGRVIFAGADPASRYLVDHAEDYRVFVLEPNTFSGHNFKQEDMSIPLALPFKSCSFENRDGSPIFTGSSRDITYLSIFKNYTTILDVLTEYSGGEELVLHILNISVCEMGIGHYIFDMLIRTKQGNSDITLYPEIEEKHVLGDLHPLHLLLSRILDKLNQPNARIGTERYDRKIKIGTGSQKRFIKIKKIMHIGSKNYSKENKSFGAREVDWSHRFEVRGHWRKLHEGIGKNRSGEYLVKGWTWVSNHVKGPEDKPLITKTRVYHEKENRQWESTSTFAE